MSKSKHLNRLFEDGDGHIYVLLKTSLGYAMVGVQDGRLAGGAWSGTVKAAIQRMEPLPFKVIATNEKEYLGYCGDDDEDVTE